MSKRDVKIEIPVPLEGSLGVLAMGAVGLKAWRKRRAEEIQNHSSRPENEQ